ncbi:hypothetical protein R2601_03673 [Salipiger bermudensis HTCC2601]|uniref:Uncharacterized protein n=1 Tax=Salipiger bermudensis (strain DSM 26914 / JCM 13377 / KCTC 12554 / HTCC2601) TaxID=314265 RepID=Q0FWB1_SALBH|nr:hypothetical protein R2601_03673 [Salipiger bermudensis HTCC2601]
MSPGGSGWRETSQSPSSASTRSPRPKRTPDRALSAR